MAFTITGEQVISYNQLRLLITITSTLTVTHLITLRWSYWGSTSGPINNKLFSIFLLTRPPPTVVGHNFLNNRLADVQLRRLSFVVIHTKLHRSIIPSTLPSLSTNVQVHYLLNCPAQPMYQRILKSHLLPEDHQLSDYKIIIITLLFLQDLYRHHHQQ